MRWSDRKSVHCGPISGYHEFLHCNWKKRKFAYGVQEYWRIFTFVILIIIMAMEMANIIFFHYIIDILEIVLFPIYKYIYYSNPAWHPTWHWNPAWNPESRVKSLRRWNPAWNPESRL